MYGIYEVMSGLLLKVFKDGRIMTFDKTNIRTNGRKDNRKGKELRPSINRYGYAQVTVSHNGRRKTLLVHRLVASVFIPNPTEKPTVNHIDGDKLNNVVANLEWSTHKEQRRHADALGLTSENNDALRASNHARSIPVVFRGIKYRSINQAARENNVHERVIRREGEMHNEQLGN